MSKAGKSIFYFGYWVVVCGAAMLMFPELCLRASGITLNNYMMVRVLGLTLLYLAVYYFASGRNPASISFYKATVFTRGSAPFVMLVFMLLGLSGPEAILLTLVDFAGAIWTATALRADGSWGGRRFSR